MQVGFRSKKGNCRPKDGAERKGKCGNLSRKRQIADRNRKRAWAEKGII